MPSVYPNYREPILSLLRRCPGLTVREIADDMQGDAAQADSEFAGVLSSLLTLTQTGSVRREGNSYFAEESR